MNKVLTALIALSSYMAEGLAQNVDSTLLRPSFALEYTTELQTDFHRAKWDNLLTVDAELPVSSRFSLGLGALCIATTDENALADDLQGFSNLDADNVPLSLTMAGVRWQIGERHSLYGGIRRVDEDYFCSDLLALYTNSSCGIFPTVSANCDIAIYPMAAVGVHYAYEGEQVGVLASLYNGRGHNRFVGRENVFRFCPGSDGLFALSQVEYRLHDSHYYLGGSVHYGDLSGERRMRPVTWLYAEQTVTPQLSLLAVYSHAFSGDSACRDFVGLGGQYSLGCATMGLFTDYTRIEGIGEWATELTCSFACSQVLSLQPVLHLLNTDGRRVCIGMLRMVIEL